MTFYLASRYDSKLFLRGVRDKLQAMGHAVLSTWLTEEEPLNVQIDDVDPDTLVDYALQDLAEILEADVFVHFQNQNRPNIRGGSSVEFGIALAKEKKMIVVGDRINIFDFMPIVTCFPTVEEFLWWAATIKDNE